MYLSTIEVIGFKSFAQRINVNFDAGVTAIVGPNGCGKTNIVDAIRWALGEQRYSTLRSDKMEDVIFNGTKNRKPLGLAEVSLTIENTKGVLPTEYSEVTITRRVFRSGESEYLLNKVPCRLKDILDLFMDTGMGSDAYSVIELKMVESILSDKTDERRKLFEEAAGVTKYKHRRKAAMRKLEDVQSDLTRVNDIVKEVQKTVSSLERQSKKAEQYNEVSARLKGLEVDLLEREYAHLQGKLNPLEEKFVRATSDKSHIDEELRAREEQIEKLRSDMNQIEAELFDLQQQSSLSYDTIHRTEEKMLVANERKKSLMSNVERYEKEKRDLQQQSLLLAEERMVLSGKQIQQQAELTAAKEKHLIAQVEYELSAKEVDSKKSEVQSLRDTILQVAHDVVQKHGEQERTKTRMDNLRGRTDRSVEDITLYEEDVRRNEELIRNLSEKDRDLRRKFAEAEVALVEREDARKSLKQDIDDLLKKSLEIMHEIERRKSKIDFIRRMMESGEGFSEGAKYLLNRDDWKKKHIATIADVIETEEKYRSAIEAALAEMAQVVVVDTVEDGYAALEELSRQQKGRASFLCLQWVPKIRKRNKKHNDALCVRAADVVQCEERFRPLVHFLLDDVLLVNHLSDAREVFSVHAGIRCISLDGQVATSAGVLRGGSRRTDETGLLGKKTQIAELEKEIGELQTSYEKIHAELSETRLELESADLKSFIGAVKAIEKEMTAIEMRIAQLEFEKKRANDAIERNRTEILSLGNEIIGLQRQYETISSELAILEEKKANEETLAYRSRRELEVAEHWFEEKTRSVNEIEHKVVTLQSDVWNVERDLERADARSQDIRVTQERRDVEILHAGEEIARLASDIGSFEIEQSTLHAEHEILLKKKKEVEQTHHSYRNDIHQLELKIKDERRLHDDSVSTAHELEMKISELKSNIEHILQRAEVEFELVLQLKTYPEDEWIDFAQRREEVKNLKDRIRILGAINFAAFDEFTTESERLNFLTQQRDDLVDAEKTLLSTIDEINTTAQRIFVETFSKIRENFIVIFKELFMEGDECDLRIEENVDPLEASIEIIAKPRGKRPTSIDLLSGGEKTLTAIALLFAIYLVKPSPFCILDEVDAPLDDSNIDRYTKILKKFSDNTQFIVVTHNKRTMEAASALYGVTMEEEGISKIVTVRFNEEARIRSATVTN